MNFAKSVPAVREVKSNSAGVERTLIPHPLHPGGKYYPERRKERQGQIEGDTDQHARGDAIPNSTNAIHGISSKGNPTLIASGNNPENPSGGFSPSGDHTVYEDWRHGDRWA